MRREVFELITDKSKLSGTAYFEFLPRQYQGRCWNSDSVYIADEAILYFDKLLLKHVPNYGHFNFMDANYEAAQSLANDLFKYAQDVDTPCGIDILVQKYGVHPQFVDELREDWLGQKQTLSEMLFRLASWIRENIRPGGYLSVLGI